MIIFGLVLPLAAIMGFALASPLEPTTLLLVGVVTGLLLLPIMLMVMLALGGAYLTVKQKWDKGQHEWEALTGQPATPMPPSKLWDFENLPIEVTIYYIGGVACAVGGRRRGSCKGGRKGGGPAALGYREERERPDAD